jgi:hypothetical protein
MVSRNHQKRLLRAAALAESKSNIPDHEREASRGAVGLEKKEVQI